MNARNFLTELKRRNVYKAAIAYAVAAWLVIQVATQVFPFFGVPDWTVRMVILLLLLGFPGVLAFSWAFEITPEGIKRESELAESDRSIGRNAGRKLVAITVVLALMAAGLFLFRLMERTRPAARVDGSANESRSAAIAAIPEKSIAVLPFQNLSDDKGNAYFSEGIEEEILTRLANIAELKVISHTSTRRFKSESDDPREVAQQLSVAHLLEGSVQKSNDQVRVNVRLIRASNGSQAWAETYDRKLTDIFAVEGEIATKVAEQLQAKLTGSAKLLLASRPTENAEAHQLYLQGLYYNRRGAAADYRKAIDFYQRAIQLDPRYALAQSKLSTAWINLARKFLAGDEAQEAYAQARAAAEAALFLEPNLAAAHEARGVVLAAADFNWKEAEAEFRRAIQLEPEESAEVSLAQLLATLGRPAQAVELAREGLVRDPLCASCYHWLAGYLSPLGRLDEAEQAIRKAIALQPGHADFYTQLAMIEIQRGDAPAALAAAEQEIEGGGWKDVALALAQQISGDPVAADAALKKLIDTQPSDAAYQIAQVYALRNDPDKVFEWLDRAWSNHDPGVDTLLYDPFLDRYQADPRFAAFCRKVHLPVPGE